jgi:hypothetical protein
VLPPKPYEAVRKQIETKLRGQRAWELGDKMVAAAITQLSAPLKDVPEEGGYKAIPSDFKAPALSAVAEAIQKQFGILPDVQRLEDRWLDEDMVQKLPGFGEAQILSGQGSAADYLFSAREFWAKPGEKPDVKNAPTDPMRRLHLQVGVPSATVFAGEGDRYIFRVTAVQVSRPPIALDEVRAQVTADATRLQAYRMLKADSDALVKRFVDEGPSTVAKAFNTERLAPPQFPRRQNDPQSGEPVVPYVLGIGRDEHFVDALFDLVNKAGGPAINSLPADKRVGAVALDSEFALVLVRVEEFTPLTRSQFEAQSRGGFLASRANAQLLSGTESTDPFSVDALSKRVNYVPRHGRDEAKDTAKSKDDNSDAGDKSATTQKG